jgi:hypothetical protein
LAHVVASFVGRIGGTSQPLQCLGMISIEVETLGGFEREFHVVGVAGLRGRNWMICV